MQIQKHVNSWKANFRDIKMVESYFVPVKDNVICVPVELKIRVV